MASTLGLKSTLAGDGAQEPVVGKTMHPSFAGRGKMSEMQARAMAYLLANGAVKIAE